MRAAFIVGDILSDGNARRAPSAPTACCFERFWSRQTGTSKDMRDNWAVGWSARYTVGVGWATPAARACTT